MSWHSSGGGLGGLRIFGTQDRDAGVVFGAASRHQEKGVHSIMNGVMGGGRGLELGCMEKWPVSHAGGPFLGLVLLFTALKFLVFE